MGPRVRPTPPRPSPIALRIRAGGCHSRLTNSRASANARIEQGIPLRCRAHADTLGGFRAQPPHSWSLLPRGSGVAWEARSQNRHADGYRPARRRAGRNARGAGPPVSGQHRGSRPRDSGESLRLDLAQTCAANPEPLARDGEARQRFRRLQLLRHASMNADSALVLLSGGQDSATCLAWALARFAHVETIGFDYGQRHRPELEAR